jgi:hypothetical protein
MRKNHFAFADATAASAFLIFSSNDIALLAIVSTYLLLPVQPPAFQMPQSRSAEDLH